MYCGNWQDNAPNSFEELSDWKRREPATGLADRGLDRRERELNPRGRFWARA
jgi:hypothetical protein